ncbi:MAG: AAA family ATPase [Succinivibrionaceae bacterium]
MKILKVSGKNIASLRHEFEINFEEECFNKCGVFAITGPTGAGKSSILDAICVALYGNADRYERGNGKSIVDGKNSGNVVNLKTKGAKDCFAEVCYEGKNGERCISRWEIKTKKGTPTLTFSLLDRSGTTVVGLQKVRAKNEEMLGLNWDQFRRIIVLPQGKFNNFLFAQPSERAALLEEITGTKIYKEVSKRVQEKYKLFEKEVESQQFLIDSVNCLSQDDYNALLEEREYVLKDVNEYKKILSAIDSAKKLLEKHQNAQKESMEAENIFKDAELNKRNQKPKKILITDYNNFIKHKSSFDLLCSEEEELKIAKNKKQKYEEDLEINTQKENKAKKAFEEAQTNLTDFISKKNDYSKDIKSAIELDVEIQTFEKKINEEQEILQVKNEKFKNVNNEKLKITNIIKELEKEQNKAEITIKNNELFNSIVGDWLFINDLLISQFNEINKFEHNKTIIQDSELKASHLNAKKVKLLDEHQRKNNELNKLKSNLNNFNENELRCKKNELDNEIEELRKKYSSLKDFIIESKKIVEYKEDISAKENERLKITSENISLYEQKKVIENELLSLGKLHDKYEKEKEHVVVESKLVEYRKDLKDGEPCPLCGAIHHNISEVNDEELQARVKTLDKEVANLKEQIESKQKILNKSENIISSNEGVVIRIKNDVKGLQKKLEAQILIINEKLRDKEIEQISANNSLKDWKILISKKQTELESIENEGKALKGTITTIDEQLCSIATENKEILKFQEELNNLKENISNIELECTKINLDKLIESNKELQNSILLRTEKIKNNIKSEELYTYLLKALNQPNTDSCKNWLEKNVAEKISEKNAANTKLSDVKNKIEIEKNNFNNICNQYYSADEECKKTIANIKKIEANLIDKKKNRSGLLGGKTVEDFENEVVIKENTLKNEESKAKELLEIITKCSTSIQTNIESIDKDIKTKTQVVESKRNDYKNLLILLNTTDEYFRDIISKTSENIKNIEKALNEAEECLKQAEQNFNIKRELLKQRNDEYLEIIRGLPVDAIQMDNSINKSFEDDINKKYQERSLELDKITGSIVADDNAKSKKAEMKKKLEEFKISNSTIVNLYRCIGQPDEFNRFAQSITFSNLLNVANSYINKFKPRYKLKSYVDQENGVCDGNLNLVAIDCQNADEERFAHQLSGGEAFIVSLSLAIALSDITSKGNSIKSLFIDEGLGSLDADSLDTVITGLESINNINGRNIGIISHVEALKERVQLRINVEPEDSNIASSKIRISY